MIRNESLGSNMAFFGRRYIVEAFRSNGELQQFFLTPTGTKLGTGSFGTVEEVVCKHRVCAGKKLHETLIDVGNEGVGEVVHKYQQECQLMSSLRHPNITQFLGLCFLSDTQLPLLVMECLDTSLDDLLERIPNHNLSLSLKRSVLEDVACGLLYLHEVQPDPVIHRDLTSKNVLLTSSLVAKITDMGNSRIVDMRPGKVAKTLSKLPGTLVYMLPEAQDDRHRYGPSLDIFSFGHLALYTITQQFPGDLLPSTFTNPDNVEEVRARNEVERRGRYIEMLEHQINSLHPGLVVLVKQCLHNAPQERPSTEQLLTRLQGMRGQVEGEYGGSVIKLDLEKLRLAKEVKVKRLQLLAQQMERREAEFEEHAQQLQEQVEAKDKVIAQIREQVDAKDQEIKAKENVIAQMQEQVKAKGNLVAQLQRDIAACNDLTVQLRRDISAKDTHLEGLAREIQRLREKSLTEQRSKDAEISKLSEALKILQASHQQKLHRDSLKLTWRHGSDMPCGMSGHVQSAVVQGTLYIGGGISDSTAIHDKTVLKYDISSGKWTTLPPYKTIGFAMAAVKNQLILVGGIDDGDTSKKVGVWRADRKDWTHPYPDMPSARFWCSAAPYAEWLVVVGGFNGKSLPSAELLNVNTKQWHIAPCLPAPQDTMKLAIANDILYCMGGRQNSGKMFSVSLPTLLRHITTSDGEVQKQVWNVKELKQTCTTPLSIRGSLLIVGGRNKDDNTIISDIYLYQPNTGELVKIGGMPTPRSLCTCAIISDSEFAVVGGMDKMEKTKRMDIASIDFSWSHS